MTPEAALQLLDAIAALAPVNRQTHAQAIEARTVLAAAIAPREETDAA